MNADEKIEWLKEYKYCWQRIRSTSEQMEEIKAVAEKCTSTLTGMPGGGGGNRVEDCVCRMAELTDSLDIDTKLYQKKTQEINNAICSIERKECRTVLALRYMCFKPYEDIANEMNYSERQIYRLHDEAIELLEVPESCQ